MIHSLGAAMLFTDELVFTHIPKTGGVAISNVLHRAAQRAGKECFGNYPIDAISAEGAVYAWAKRVPWSYTYTHSGLADSHSKDAWKDRKRLGSIRNPWDWYRSWYLFNRKSAVRFGGMTAHIIDSYASPKNMNAVIERAVYPDLLAGDRTWPILWPEEAHKSLDYFDACKRMKCGLLTMLTIRVMSSNAYSIIENGTEKDLANGLLPLLDYDALIPTETLAESLVSAIDRLDLSQAVDDDPVIYKGSRPNHAGQWQGTSYAATQERLSKSVIKLIAKREKHYIDAFGYTGPGSVPRSLVFFR